MISINTYRLKKNYLGGVETVYLFPYTKYSRTQITTVGQELTVFPATTIYHTYSSSTNYSEQTEIEGGAIGYNQNFSIQVPKTMLESEIYSIVQQRYRAIYIDRIGNIRILGLYNGLDAQITNETGQDKPSLNGYRVTFTGKEDNQAYWIDDLSTVGFTILAENENFTFEDGCNYVFEDEENYIFE